MGSGFKYAGEGGKGNQTKLLTNFTMDWFTLTPGRGGDSLCDFSDASCPMGGGGGGVLINETGPSDIGCGYGYGGGGGVNGLPGVVVIELSASTGQPNNDSSGLMSSVLTLVLSVFISIFS